MINNDAEKCRGCTIKHLSEALVGASLSKPLTKLDIAYICGNLGHAANHFVHFSPELAACIRTLRLDSINDDLTLAIDQSVLVTRLEQLIDAIASWKEPPPEAIPIQPDKNLTPTIKKTGCRCRQSN